MIALVNEDLLSFEPTFVRDNTSRKSFFKLKVLTSNRILQKIVPENSRGKKRKTDSSSPEDENYIVNRSERIVPLNREIIRISAPVSEITELFPKDSKISCFPVKWKDYPMSVNVTTLTRYTTQVDLRCHMTGEDRANLFVIPFPFNGMIKPLTEDPRYRIYKGFIANSAKPFFHNNRKYRKVLYLIIEINKNLFKEDHRYHTDSIDLDFESYALFNNKETNRENTNHETMHLSITSPNGDFTLSWDYETIDEPVMMHMKDMDLWPIYRFNKESYHDSGKNTKVIRAGRKKPAQRPVTVEGNVMVTTNRHGIRKEIPINTNRKYYKSNYDKPSDGYKVDNEQKNYTRGNNHGKKFQNRGKK